MGWISETSDSEAQGQLRQIYDAVKAQRGKVARIPSVHSLDPGALQHHLDLYMAIREASKNRKAIHHWKPALQSFQVMFGRDRMPLAAP